MPNPQEFDVQSARKAGASDDDILQYLQGTGRFDVQGAIKSGASKGDIIQYLASTPKKGTSGGARSQANLANQALAQSGINVAPLSAPKQDVHKVDVIGGLARRGPTLLPAPPTELPGSFEGKPENVGHDQSVLAVPALITKNYIKKQQQNPETPNWYKKGVAAPALAGTDFIEGLGKPSTILTLGAAKAVGAATPLARTVQRGAQAYFGTKMATGAVDATQQARDLHQQGKDEEAIQALTSAGFDAAMAADMVHSFAKSSKGSVQDLAKLPGARTAIEKTTEAVRGARTAWNPTKNITPEQAATKALKPRNSKANWKNELQTALPDSRRAADSLGINPEDMTLDDAQRAVGRAKADVWDEYQKNFSIPVEKMTGDTTPVADRIRSTVSQRTREQNPGLAKRIDKIADTYDKRSMTMQEIESRVAELNNQTRSIEAKYVTDKRAAKLDPKNAPLFAERDALRQTLLDKMNTEMGEGAAGLRKRWGALNSMEDVISRRIPVSDRRNPVSLTRIFQLIHGPARIAKGVVSGSVGDIVGGTVATKAMMNAEKMNDPNWLIQQAFTKTTPTPPALLRIPGRLKP